MSADPIPRRTPCAREVHDLFRPLGRRGARLSLLAAVLTLAALAGCAPADAPLTPVFRLTQVLEPALDQVPLHCDVADDFRPAIGCVATIPLPVQQMPRPDNRVLVVPVQIPEGVTGGSPLVAFDPRVRGPREEWRRTPTMLMDTPPDGALELLHLALFPAPL